MGMVLHRMKRELQSIVAQLKPSRIHVSPDFNSLLEKEQRDLVNLPAEHYYFLEWGCLFQYEHLVELADQSAVFVLVEHDVLPSRTA